MVVLNRQKARPSCKPNRVPRHLDKTPKPVLNHPPTMIFIVSTDSRSVEDCVMNFMKAFGEEAGCMLSPLSLAGLGCLSVATGFAEVECDMSSDLFRRIRKSVIAELAKSN